MNAIVKNTKSGVHRVHASTAQMKPVCGGGFQARRANWQQDIGECNCRRCLSILARLAAPPQLKKPQP